MGKVASKSIHGSLQSVWPGLVVHAHGFAYDLPHVDLVKDYCLDGNKKVYVITPVRDPIARNVSAFFERFKLHTGVKYGDHEFTISQMIDLFLEEFPHDVPTSWFDDVFYPPVGIDVYEYDFPSRGFRVIKEGNVELLILRIETENEVMERSIEKLTGIDDFDLQRSNVGKEKEYSEEYTVFKRSFVPPSWYFEKMYDSKYFTHFYEGWRERLIEKWTTEDE